MKAPRMQQGFTLIELMVGVVLGMLTMLVIAQVTIQSEERKRMISMGNDAQVNGSLALFTVQRDVQMSGYGSSVPEAMGCSVLAKFESSGPTISFTLAPTLITDGANGMPDTITVLHARTHDFSVPIRVGENHPQTANAFVVDSSLGVSEKDMMIAVPQAGGSGGTCALFTVKEDTSGTMTALGPKRIPHVTSNAAKWNQSSIFPVGGFAAGSYLLNMGQLANRSYTVNGDNNLVAKEVSPIDGTVSDQELYPQIVNLQAMYGKDSDGDDVVDRYDTTTPTSATDWKKVLTIRIAVVARSNQYEKDAVTTSAPQWNVGNNATIGGATTVSCNNGSKCINLKVDHVDGWQHYRYKVYETIVPLRNVLWNS